MLIYAAIIFFLVTLGSMTLLVWLVPSKSRRRLQELGQSTEGTDWVKTVIGLASPLAKLSVPDGKWEDSPLRLKFINAGIRSKNAPIIFYAAKTFLPLVFAALTYIALELENQRQKRLGRVED